MNTNVNNISFEKWNRIEKLDVADWAGRAARAQKSAEVIRERKEKALVNGNGTYAERLQTYIDKHLSNAQILNKRAEGRLSFHA